MEAKRQVVPDEGAQNGRPRVEPEDRLARSAPPALQEAHRQKAESKHAQARRFSIAGGQRRTSVVKVLDDDVKQARAYVASVLENMARDRRRMFSENSDTVRRMDTTMIVLLLFTATVTPYEVCFLSENAFDGLFFINRLVDIGFIADMGLQFFTIYTSDTGEQITDHKLIAKRYLKGWFAVDLLAILPIPFEFLSAANSDSFSSGNKMKVLRFFRMMRIVKLARIFRASRLLRRWESRFGINYSVMGLLRYLMILMMLTHWGACFWYMAATLSQLDEQNWVKDRGLCETGTESRRLVNCAPQARLYLYSLYNAVSVMYGGTCADGFMPLSDSEHLIATIMIICGATSWAYAIGGICNYVDSRNKATKAFHTTVDTMNMFLADHHVSRPLTIKTREFFQRAKPVIRAQFYDETLRNCSDELRSEIVLQLHNVWFEKVKFFSKTPAEEKERFIIAIAFALRLRLYAKGDPVIRMNELCEDMFIVYKGLVALLGKVLGPAKVLGEDMILCLQHAEWRRHYSARSLTFAQLHALSHDGLKELLEHEDLPKTQQMLRKAAIRLCFLRTVIAVAHSHRMQKELAKVMQTQALPSMQKAAVPKRPALAPDPRGCGGQIEAQAQIVRLVQQLVPLLQAHSPGLLHPPSPSSAHSGMQLAGGNIPAPEG